nr:biopolymer transporter ExbD [uncultured Rhodoferax sp.]
MPAVAGRGRGRRTINEINMVPFIDVMLVLLIIFMVTAPLITPSMIDTPSVGKAKGQPKQVIQVVLTKDETLDVTFEGKTHSVQLKELASAVKRIQDPLGDAIKSDFAVVISADKNAKYESVVNVMSTLHNADIKHVGLAVQLAN